MMTTAADATAMPIIAPVLRDLEGDCVVEEGEGKEDVDRVVAGEDEVDGEEAAEEPLATTPVRLPPLLFAFTVRATVLVNSAYGAQPYPKEVPGYMYVAQYGVGETLWRQVSRKRGKNALPNTTKKEADQIRLF
jgi:hypothetical protein